MIYCCKADIRKPFYCLQEDAGIEKGMVIMMSLFKEVFKRYEKKYLLTEEQYMKMQLRLKGLAKIDDYGKSTACNVYFDTPDFQMIRNSLEKPVYKEKLRLRSYGLPKEEDSVFIEIKKK